MRGDVPVGACYILLKSFANTPALSDDQVECNGQVLSDPQSRFHGQTIANRNGSGGGTKRFVRGSTTSGSTGGIESHNHGQGAEGNQVTGLTSNNCNYSWMTLTPSLIGTTTALPSYLEGVWVKRVK